MKCRTVVLARDLVPEGQETFPISCFRAARTGIFVLLFSFIE